jgi:hypothetical protein
VQADYHEPMSPRVTQGYILDVTPAVTAPHRNRRVDFELVTFMMTALDRSVTSGAHMTHIGHVPYGLGLTIFSAVWTAAVS